jgi:hypothetical protein
VVDQWLRQDGGGRSLDGGGVQYKRLPGDPGRDPRQFSNLSSPICLCRELDPASPWRGRVSRVSETSTTPTVSDDDTVRRGKQQRAATRQAWTVVLVITLIAALVIAQFAFSTANDNQSVDGSTATSSQYVDG